MSKELKLKAEWKAKAFEMAGYTVGEIVHSDGKSEFQTTDRLGNVRHHVYTEADAVVTLQKVTPPDGYVKPPAKKVRVPTKKKADK